MAIYYLDVKPIGGNSCRSAIGAAAYRAGEKLHNEHDGITHDYTKRRGVIGAAAYHSGERLNDGNIAHDFTQKGGIVYSEIMLPKHALEAFRDRSTLWNSAEKAERNYNSRTGREIVVALPNELTTEQQIEVVRDYVQRNFVDEGMCADFSIHSGHIHEKKGEIYPFQDLTVRKDNPHAHIQLTVRPLNKDGSWGEKSKNEYILDKNGDRIKLPNGKWKRRKIELTDWDKRETLLKWREDWASTINKEFERLGIDERISHLSLKEQGINREPTKHMGHEAWNLEKKGIKTKFGDENRDIMRRNKALEQLEKETLNHELSICEDLASMRNEQAINHKPTAYVTPEITAEYIHELKQGYFLLDKEISVITQEVDEAQREINSAMVKTEKLDEYAEEISTLKGRVEELKKQRQEMGIFTSKKAVDEQIKSLSRSHEQANNYFKQTYNIAPEESTTKIKQLEIEIKEMKQAKERLQAVLPSLLVDKEAFKLEYHKQKMLADISRDRQRILNRLEQIEKETRKNRLSPKDEIARMRSETDLDKMTEQDFDKIMHDILPEQREILTRKHEREKEKEQKWNKELVHDYSLTPSL